MCQTDHWRVLDPCKNIKTRTVFHKQSTHYNPPPYTHTHNRYTQLYSFLSFFWTANFALSHLFPPLFPLTLIPLTYLSSFILPHCPSHPCYCIILFSPFTSPPNPLLPFLLLFPYPNVPFKAPIFHFLISFIIPSLHSSYHPYILLLPSLPLTTVVSSVAILPLCLTLCLLPLLLSLMRAQGETEREVSQFLYWLPYSSIICLRGKLGPFPTRNFTW